MLRHVHALPLAVGAMTYYMPADAQFVGIGELQGSPHIFYLYDPMQMVDARKFLVICSSDTIYDDDNVSLISRGVYSGNGGELMFVFEKSYQATKGKS